MGLKPEQFVNDVDEHLFCSICQEVLQDPHGCKEGHSFCKDCITEWLKTKQTCPLDNSVLQVNNLVRTLIAHNMVQNLEVWCHPPEKDKAGFGAPEPEAKCQWKGKLQSLSRHRETCPFQQVRCPREKCKETMQRRELEDHDKKCEFKAIQCKKCKQKFFRFRLQGHIADECPETLIPCPYKCTTQGQVQIQKIKRADLDYHLNNICPKAILECQFKDQGCLVRVERQLVDKHVQDNMATHMMLLAKQCSSLTTENNRLKGELNQLKEEFHAHLSSSSGYDWTVSDYPNLYKIHPNGSCIKSPIFWLCGHRWRFSLYPNGNSKDDTGFLSLFLQKVGNELSSLSDSNITNNESKITYRIGVISQEDSTDHVYVQAKDVFAKAGRGSHRLMKASDALLPSYCTNGNLTIQCTIQLDKPQ